MAARRGEVDIGRELVVISWSACAVAVAVAVELSKHRGRWGGRWIAGGKDWADGAGAKRDSRRGSSDCLAHRNSSIKPSS